MHERHVSRLKKVEKIIRSAVPDEAKEERLLWMRIENICKGLEMFGCYVKDPESVEWIVDSLKALNITLTNKEEVIRAIIRKQRGEIELG